MHSHGDDTPALAGALKQDLKEIPTAACPCRLLLKVVVKIICTALILLTKYLKIT